MIKDWWKDFFGKEYVETYTEAGHFAATKKQTNFLIKYAFPKNTKTILDLCCGHGRHSIELAKKGYKVTGLDYSAYEINLAKQEAERKRLSIDFRRGDARNYRPGGKFDAVINMFTAFGYGSRADDIKILKTVSRSLRKNGTFFIDLMNLPWLWRNYKPVSKQSLGDYKVVARRSFDFLDNVIREARVISQGKRTKKVNSITRLYSLPELTQLLKHQNLKVIQTWGSFAAEPYGLDSKRMLVLAKKS